MYKYIKSADEEEKPVELPKTKRGYFYQVYNCYPRNCRVPRDEIARTVYYSEREYECVLKKQGYLVNYDGMELAITENSPVTPGYQPNYWLITSVETGRGFISFKSKKEALEYIVTNTDKLKEACRLTKYLVLTDDIKQQADEVFRKYGEQKC